MAATNLASTPLSCHGRLLDGVIDQTDSLLIAELVPQAITGQHHKLILAAQLMLSHLRLSCDSRLQVCVPQGPALGCWSHLQMRSSHAYFA